VISPAPVKLTVNGEPREVPEGTTLQGLLASLKIGAERVAVEVNAEVVRKAKHAEHRLQPGDQVEVVTFVGGG
jgi:sulfur carrier protein